MSFAPTQIASAARLDAGSEWRLRLDEGRALIRLAVPIALIALVNMGMSVTDAVMVSALSGTDAFAAVAVGSDLYSIVFYLCAGVLGGIAPFYTAAATRSDGTERRRLERIGWVTVGLLAALTIPLVWLAPVWLQRIGLDPGLLQRGQGYTRAMALTLIPMLGVALYRTILTAAGRPKVFLYVTLAMLPLNALGNYVLMVGAGPIPALGPTGAGVSSLLVAAAILAVLAVVARRSRPAGAAVSGEGPALDWAGLAAVLRVGVPIGVATVTEVGIYLAATLYAAALGAAAVAAHTLTLRTAGIAYAVPTALLQAAMVRMARAESLADVRLGRAVVASTMGLSLVLGTAILLVLTTAAAPLAQTFFDDSPAGVAAAELALGLLLLLGLTELVINPGLAAAGLLRGCKDTRTPMVYVLLGYWGVSAPLGIYLCEVGAMGITGIWIGLAAGTSVTAALTIGRLFARPDWVGSAAPSATPIASGSP